jgi:multiple sugar transport system permease protein
MPDRETAALSTITAATVITAPLVLAFLVAQRWFIDGVTMTSVK